MSDEDQSKSTRRMWIRPVTLEPDGRRLSPVAVCPRKLDLVRVADCGACEHFMELRINPESGEPFMRCEFDVATFVHDETHAPPNGARQERCLVRDAMTLPPRCATLDMTLARIMSDLLAQTDAVPVIDEGGRAIGVITRADVLERLRLADERAGDLPRRTALGHAPADTPLDEALLVRDMMLSRSFMVSADAALEHVAAVMAYERVHHVLVADADRRLLGLVSALDIARWVARRAGYVVPALEQS